MVVKSWGEAVRAYVDICIFGEDYARGEHCYTLTLNRLRDEILSAYSDLEGAIDNYTQDQIAIATASLAASLAAANAENAKLLKIICSLTDIPVSEDGVGDVCTYCGAYADEDDFDKDLESEGVHKSDCPWWVGCTLTAPIRAELREKKLNLILFC